MATVDIFTPIYQALRAGLAAQYGTLVKSGNLIDMSALTFQRFKTAVQPGDLPEVILLQGPFVLSPLGSRNSKVSSFSQIFPLICTEDTLSIVPTNIWKTYTAIALLKMGDNLGLPNVGSWTLGGGSDDAFGQKEWKRDTERWVSVLNISVEFYLGRNDLLAIPPFGT